MQLEPRIYIEMTWEMIGRQVMNGFITNDFGFQLANYRLQLKNFKSRGIEVKSDQVV